MSLYSDLRSSLRRSHSLPHITSSSSRTDSGLGYSGSCSDLDQLSQYQYGYVNHYHDHPHENGAHHRHNQHHRHHHHSHHGPEPKNGARLVTDLRQLMTLRQHYYPEGGWGWLITAIGMIMQCLAHGIHMAAGVFMVEIMRTFRVSSIRAGDHNKRVCLIWTLIGICYLIGRPA